MFAWHASCCCCYCCVGWLAGCELLVAYLARQRGGGGTWFLCLTKLLLLLPVFLLSPKITHLRSHTCPYHHDPTAVVLRAVANTPSARGASKSQCPSHAPMLFSLQRPWHACRCADAMPHNARNQNAHPRHTPTSPHIQY